MLLPVSIAVALPVELFLQRAFEVCAARRRSCISARSCLPHALACPATLQIANEVDGAPEAWLIWAGLWKLLLGKKGHASWHFTDESRSPPSKLAMFIMRSENPPWFEVLAWRLEESPLRPFMRLLALGYEFEAWLELPDTLRDLALFLPRLLAALARCILRKPAPAEAEGESKDEGSETSAETAARRDRLRKRLCASAGFMGIYLVWTIFAWCAPRPGLHMLCTAMHAPSLTLPMRTIPGSSSPVRCLHARAHIVRSC